MMSPGRGAVAILRWPLNSCQRRNSRDPTTNLSSLLVPTVTAARSFSSAMPRRSTVYRVSRAKVNKARAPDILPAHNNQGERETALEQLYTHSRWIYKDAQKMGIIDSKMTHKDFHIIASVILHVMDLRIRSGDSTQKGVKTIHDDPNKVYEVAVALSMAMPWDKRINSWAVTATAKAGAVYPIALMVYSQISRVGYPEQTPELNRIEYLVKEHEHPLAMRVYAEVLWSKEMPAEAIEMLERVYKRTHPSHARVRFREDITISDSISPPWKRLIEFYNLCGFYEKADEMTKVGALEYRDPDALLAYALLMKEQENWHAYSQCVIMAATAGHADACYRLGNYYYRIFKGSIPSPDQVDKDAGLIGSFFYTLLGQARRKSEFRKLAMDWYELAFLHGNTHALRNYAVLLREDGNRETAANVLSNLEHRKEEWGSPNIKKLRQRFYDDTFKPKIPDSWLEL
ncbi:hypothetical protein BGW36DRAFT_370831 [Talaromyces proteolyticus]|uniref:Uncharacterized protein n=1 Tax=Talaromyces proteolyticus TaxID=1131652 RepID=A0AAD4L0W6_9EURO|nr:uncharacterized protein BGW36DRAFT_370831 [Talaromyces proteolyticus]KAH8704183.1 hypothetical protein BGW36DRAFT_370831 [Talaromyces proteolyticus]